ncbi:hypothetical protein GXM_06325 [Nostoc sphaeroides CCNUC1]|uniref:Uncharacterized protein n=1 Tax=Nostoc sphaeroides CCNUC1 TaxID=2653204 RepID=A0A5P8W8E7_9NOSO|nr:hypothetical protein GXM_06325 [Nostoc sphaeroides CCNUC1]
MSQGVGSLTTFICTVERCRVIFHSFRTGKRLAISLTALLGTI